MKSLVKGNEDIYAVEYLSKTTFEDRKIHVATINANSKNPTIVIVAGEYAKDWMATSTALYMIRTLLN